MLAVLTPLFGGGSGKITALSGLANETFWLISIAMFISCAVIRLCPLITRAKVTACFHDTLNYARYDLPDEASALIQPLLPAEPATPRARPEQPHHPDRK